MDNPKTEEQIILEFKNNFIEEVRQERNRRLAETDYIHLPDVTVDDILKNKLLTYRQELRDVIACLENWLEDKDIYSVSVWGVPWPTRPN